MTLNEPTWDDARTIAHQLFAALPTVSISLDCAAGRVLAKDLLALVDLPTFETSAMDGYAVAGAGPWKIVAYSRAGQPLDISLSTGEAVGITTGAVIPQGTFGILRWEDATVDGDTLAGETSEGKDIRPSGAECLMGDLLISAGTVLSPAMVGLAAAVGHDEIEVRIKPKVAVIILGDEILRSGLPHNGMVRDSLGVQLPAWFAKLGCEVHATTFVEDTLDAHIDAIKSAGSADIIVTTGGTAVGERDYLHQAIDALGGEFHVDQIKVRPGHPQLLASIGGKPLLGLPGNPQSALAALMTLGVPVIESLLGIPEVQLPVIASKENLTAPTGFTRMIVGSIVDGDFISSPYLGSAMMRGVAMGTGFAVVTNPATNIRWVGLPS